MNKSVNSKKLNRIEPFNDVFYKDCFYGSLFSVLKFFNHKIDSFILNDLILYKTSSDTWLQTEIEYISGQSVKQLLNELGINCCECMKCNNIIDDILVSLNDNMPIIVKVDCYYESIRKDLYNLVHLDHGLLVYGYDNLTSTFNILEHKNKNSLRYKHEIISYTDIKKASDGYKQHYGYLKAPVYIKFYKYDNTPVKKNYNKNYYLLRYINMYLENRTLILESMNNYFILVDRLIKIIKDQNLLKKYVDEILEIITEIITAKKIKQYRFYHYVGNEELLTIIKGIINDWTFVRLSIFNFKYFGQNIDRKLQSAVSILKQIYTQEKKIVDLQYKVYENLIFNK